MSPPHPPKQEIFDVQHSINIDPKGIDRAVDEYRIAPFGLYLARPTPGRTQFHYIESWLIPKLGLRITDFWFSPGHERDQDFYLDIADIQVDGTVWQATDLYVDIVLKDGERLSVLDTDELLTATSAGFLTAEQTNQVLERTYSVVDGLASHDYRLPNWLASKGITLTWQRH